MANEITRLLPFRQYDDNDVINFYSYDGETGERETSSIIDRYVLKSGETVQGPALIQEDETTTVLDASDEITVDVLGNLVAEIRYTGV